MNSKQIKRELLEQEMTVSELAIKCEEQLGKKVYRQQVSMCIYNRRSYPEIQRAIATVLRINLEETLSVPDNL